MSRRASLLAKEQRSRPKVRFPDELVFLDNIKEGDVPAMQNMLRRVSVSIDVNAIASSGMTPLHSAVMEENTSAVRLLIRHGCDLNRKDIDSWTPLHAACANGFSDLAKVLLEGGADPSILTDDGERPYDLIEPNDLDTVGVMLSYRTMREGFEEEDEEEEEEEDEEEDREEEDADENGLEHDSETEHVENESETENVENESETENAESESETENVSCDEDSLDGENKESQSKQSISVNEDNTKHDDVNETNTDLPSPTPHILKSILKQSDKSRKTLKFET